MLDTHSLINRRRLPIQQLLRIRVKRQKHQVRIQFASIEISQVLCVLKIIVTVHVHAVAIFQAHDDHGLIQIGEVVSKRRFGDMAEGEELVRRYLDGEEKSVFRHSSFGQGVEDTEKDVRIFSRPSLPKVLPFSQGALSVRVVLRNKGRIPSPLSYRL
jgi:hypothetical protein